ncbi:MAG: branched-chain amino acid ABC transporter [Streptosporangiales bacterium]|nr:branched-chain amino acid ABC transporter [Streptosporangiales bacterium]
MPDAPYVATALAVAVAVTVALRAAPFAMKSVIQESALFADLGRWMPLGAIAILAVYCLSRIDVTAPSHGIAELTGVAVTVVVHLLRRNAVLSIVAGSMACIVLANWLLPA